MRLVTAFAAAAASLSFTVAAAAPAQLSDAQFIAANRCLGLTSAKSLASPDAAALKKLIDSQTSGRDSFIYDKADEARQDALRQANGGGPDAHAKLMAERDGVCHALVSDTTAAAPTPAHSS